MLHLAKIQVNDPAPANGRTIINLAPADLRRDAGSFDLPIALGLLVATGQLLREQVGARFSHWVAGARLGDTGYYGLWFNYGYHGSGRREPDGRQTKHERN